MARSKGNSRSYHDVAHLRPLPDVPTNYQIPTLQNYKFLRIPTPPKQCSHQVSTPYTLQILRFGTDKIFKFKVSLTRSKECHTIKLHNYTLPDVHTKYQLPTPYKLLDIAWTTFSNSRSLRQGQSPNQGHTITLHIYAFNQCPHKVLISKFLIFIS